MILPAINGCMQNGFKQAVLREIEQMMRDGVTREHYEALLWFRERLRK